MSVLSEADLAALRRVAAIPCKVPACHCIETQRLIADVVRQAAPEVADDQLALIVLKISGLVSAYAVVHNTSGTAVGGILAGVAVELASLEIGDIPR